jgi:DNA polymerase III subunit gamma/tau
MPLMQTQNFANKYRPEIFEDVWGQPRAVKYLSGLITRGQIGRSLLLYGAVGSGKTSLVRLYAKALNCLNPTDAGSPCGVCQRCAEPDRRRAGLFEFDVSGRGGDKQSVRAFVEGLNSTPTDYRFRVLFFDEAHSLTNEAADSLLKGVEEAKPGVIFCFATTEFNRIRRALQSRLAHLEVRPLSASDAISFLKIAADKEGIEYEPSALALLAGLKQGYPRDLLIGLEQVYEPGSGPLTTKQVREVFDVDHTQVLVEYFLALADGDFARQTQLMSNWGEPPAEKVKWVSAFLLALYYNDLFGKQLVVDALIHSIQQQERVEILDGFQKRLGFANRKDLEFCWPKMLEYWVGADTDVDDAAVLLRFTLFHHLVNEGLPQSRASQSGAGLAPETEQRSQLRRPALKNKDHLDPGSWEGDSEFFERAHAQAIINRASFLIQEYGVLFNASIELITGRLGADTEAEGRALVEEFVAELEEKAHEWDTQRDERFAHLTLLEDDGDGVRGLVIAHLPNPSRKDTKAELSWRQKFEAWSSGWRSERRTYGEAVSCKLELLEKRALAFHWDQTLNLCAGLSEEGERQLLELLKIPKRAWRSSARIKGGLLLASDLLQPEAIEAASRDGMEPLSAFDNGAWGWLRKGWESLEFLDRRALRDERQQQIAELEQIFGAETAEGRAAIERLVKSWPSDPRDRQRTWRGWFDED